MATSEFLPDETGSTKRPDVISVLGVLTFVNSGIFLLLYLLMFFMMLAVHKMPQDEFVTLIADAARQYVSGDDAGRVLEQMEGIARIFHTSGVSLMLIYLLRTAGRLIGAAGMWRGRRSGFHIYAAAQLIGLFAPHIFLPWSMLGVFGPLLAVAITALYGTQLKRMA